MIFCHISIGEKFEIYLGNQVGVESGRNIHVL